MEWVGEIRRAIADHRMVLYAQRIESLSTAGSGSDLHYEILVRLIGVDGRIYLPGVFLAAAERYDQAMAIDRLVVAMVLDKLAQHPAHLARLGLCHINVSAQSIANPEFRRYVMAQLDQSTVPADKLCFEITETAAIRNLAEARAFIDEMRGRGCVIALDDFGSGLSSFGYLKDLTVDILKIDGVFVRDMLDDRIDGALVHSICEVGHALGKRTIAEWAETDQVLARLREFGVDFAQGFAIHEPCPLAELIGQTDAMHATGRTGVAAVTVN
jgi:EAL domain-containing protein (putative c-di-GMP-specific phosphodiesterase class I)